MTAWAVDHNHSFERTDGVLTCTGCGAWIDDKRRKLMAVPTPTLCRLEHYTPKGWVRHGPDVNLLFPERYPARLEERNKYGRAIELDDNLQPTGQTWEPSTLPPRSKLVQTATGAWGLPDPTRRELCQWCDRHHAEPFDGSCII